MPKDMSKFRFWQSRSKTLKIAEMGFDILKILSKTRLPLCLSDLLGALGYSQRGVNSGYVINALRVLHKTGHIEGDGQVNRTRLAGDMTKVSITPAGRQLLKESRTRLEFAKRMLLERK